MWLGISSDDWVKIIIAVISLIIAIIGVFSYVNKRSHKMRDVIGDNNDVINGDVTNKRDQNVK